MKGLKVHSFNNEAKKFMAWYEQEKANGLVDIKFFVGDVSRSTTESFFREANTLNEVDSIASDLSPMSVPSPWN